MTDANDVAEKLEARAEYYAAWASDIRKLNGTSVDADHEEGTAALLRAAAARLRAMDEALARVEPKAPNGSARIWFSALTDFPDDRVFVCSSGDVWEWSVTMGDLRAARTARGES